jgi:hypothetical protein
MFYIKTDRETCKQQPEHFWELKLRSGHKREVCSELQASSKT